MLMYSRVHCASSLRFALSGLRTNTFHTDPKEGVFRMAGNGVSPYGIYYLKHFHTDIGFGFTSVKRLQVVLINSHEEVSTWLINRSRSSGPAI